MYSLKRLYNVLKREIKDRPYNPDTIKSLGIDPDFGNSKTAITFIEIVNNLELRKNYWINQYIKRG